MRKRILEPEAMKPQRPVAAEEEHRVLQFRPRSALQTSAWRANMAAQPLRQESVTERSVTERSAPERSAPAPLDLSRYEKPLDLSRYEKPREQEDDFRQRMLANVAAFAFTVALTAVGIWLAMSIADLRRTQDCVLMGRRDCVRISTP
jgi:hypothetical protein